MATVNCNLSKPVVTSETIIALLHVLESSLATDRLVEDLNTVAKAEEWVTTMLSKIQKVVTLNGPAEELKVRTYLGDIVGLEDMKRDEAYDAEEAYMEKFSI